MPPFNIVETKFVILVRCADKESAAHISAGGTVDSPFEKDLRSIERELRRRDGDAG
jgi:hypothetical protein